MNIIEQSTAKENLADETISNWFYYKYFKYGFWLQPQKGFTPSTHVEFGKKMNAVFKLSKSIYVIDRLGAKEKISVSGNEIEVYNADVRGVWVDTLHFGLPFKTKIEASVFEKLTEKEYGEGLLLNGILMEIRDNESMVDRKFEKILTVSAGNMLSYFDMIQLVSGMLCYRTCRDMNIISKLSSARGFQENVERICKDWMRELKFTGSLSEKIDNIFQTAINMLFPMIIIDNSSAYFTNPVIVGFLKKWNLIVNNNETQKSILLLLLPLLEQIFSLPWKERTEINREENYKELAKLVGHDPKFSSSLIKLVKEIHMFNLIRKTYQTDFS
jgi:myosin-crossreactive antigen